MAKSKFTTKTPQKVGRPTPQSNEIIETIFASDTESVFLYLAHYSLSLICGMFVRIDYGGLSRGGVASASRERRRRAGPNLAALTDTAIGSLGRRFRAFLRDA